jgi:3-hydroxybutyryl-CoA dehydrogenase
MARQSVVIVGGGIMGGDVATTFAAGGWDVHVMSPSQKSRDALLGRMQTGLMRIGSDPALAASARTYAALADVPWKSTDLVIESVTEHLSLKRRIFSELENLAPTGIPLATNTSSFQITKIGEHLQTRSRVLGAHYFMPAHLVPLVEVVCAEFTDVKHAENVEAILKSVGKVPVMVKKDIAGFLANRMQHALLREALSLLDQGVASPEGIDAAVRYGFGFRFIACGPLMQKEISGWDTNVAAGTEIYPTLSNVDAPPQRLRDLVANGTIGMKTKKGLWDWTDESMARERARYEQALQGAFGVLKAEEKK